MVWKLRGLGRVRILRYGAYRVFRSVFPPGRVCRILGGPLRGYKWFVAEGHQFWMPLGVYEQETARWLRE